MALDFSKRKNVPHETESFFNGTEWRLVKRGPKYSNTYRITEFDADGEKWLKSIERKEEIKQGEKQP